MDGYKKSRKKNSKKQKDERKELIKAYVILCLFVVFIGILVIFLNKGDTEDNIVKEDSKNMIEENAGSYSYFFTLTIDNEKYIYEGLHYGVKDQFTIAHDGEVIDYYKYGDIGLRKEKNNYVLCDVPYYYIDFFDMDLIEDLVDMGNYDKEGKFYKIPTSNFAYVLGEEINSTKNNIIKMSTVDEYTKKIYIDYTNYVISMGEDVKNVTIEMLYSDINKIKDFEIE